MVLNCGIWWASRSKNGVGILVDEFLREHVIEVRRVNDLIMAIKLVIGMSSLNVVCMYALYVGLGKEVKSSIWENVDELVRIIPQDELLVIGEDFNRHIRSSSVGFG